MCFDIWWTFGGFRSLQGSMKQRDRKKFIMYSMYAWGSASILTIICAIMDFVPSVPREFIRPEFGVQKCWFNTETAKALYFYGPMSITVVCNICLFISTALKIVRHKKDTAHHLKGSESQRHDDNKQWFNLYLKLFIVMGINWSMEIVSWLFKSAPQYTWYLTDLTNTLQGLIIFIIFVWKKKIKRLLLKRFGCQNRGPFSRNSTRSGYHSSASRTCTTTSGVIPLQEKISPYVQGNCRSKNSSDEVDP